MDVRTLYSVKASHFICVDIEHAHDCTGVSVNHFETIATKGLAFIMVRGKRSQK